MKAHPVIVWFRRDLRLADNPALAAALARGRPVLPVYVWPPHDEGAWSTGTAGRRWLGASLTALGEALRMRGLQLVVREGRCVQVLTALARESGAKAVFWNRRYEPAALKAEQHVERALDAEGIEAASFNAALLFEPWAVEKGAGGPYRVFTQFWKRCLAQGFDASPAPLPSAPWIAPGKWPASHALGALGLVRPAGWSGMWTPGEAGAHARLERFLDGGLEHYAEGRDLPEHDWTSRLSPHLAFGEIGPRQVWQAVQGRAAADPARLARHAEKFLSELGWREFSYHLLYHFPHTAHAPLDKRFERLEWRTDPEALAAWQTGHTGYPIVDAGMRQLQACGWMHNRVRMIAASFLTKDLLLPWQEGAAWFWDSLADADVANNTQGWQWTAGCGADAAPFFRVFNPVAQGQRFDPSGAYVRQWLPELQRVPDRWIHAPWKAPERVLNEAEVVLDKTYPRPIVDHAEARARALEAFASLRVPAEL